MTWEKLTDNVFMSHYTQPSGMHLACYALKLPDGSCIVHGPLSKIDPLSIEPFAGKVSIILAPNHYHHLGLPRWRSAWPEAIVVASSTAIPRLQKQGHQNLQPLSAVSSKLGSAVQLVEIQGTKTGETFLIYQASPNEFHWIICDALFNISGPLAGFMGFVLKITQTAPGLTFGRTFRWLAIKNKSVFLQSFQETFQKYPPKAIYFSHGDPLNVSTDTVKTILEMVSERLA